MSRSYKKSYAYFACCNSQKAWRSSYNRRFRHIENMHARSNDEDHLFMNTPYKCGYADLWSGPTDGHSYYITPRDMGEDYVRRSFCKFKRKGHFLRHK